MMAVHTQQGPKTALPAFAHTQMTVHIPLI